jgi:hypothetical protein
MIVPVPIVTFLDAEYNYALVQLKLAYETGPDRLDAIRTAGRGIYQATYDKLGRSFLAAYHAGQSSVKITISHVHSTPPNYNYRKIATIYQYQRLAIETFGHELRVKGYCIAHGEFSDYRPIQTRMIILITVTATTTLQSLFDSCYIRQTMPVFLIS